MAQSSLSTVSNLFKIKYGKKSDNTFNSKNVILGRIKQEKDFVGKRLDVAVPTSFGGGVGSGALPTANYQSVEDAQLTAKKTYSVISIEREALLASANDEGAFERLMDGRAKVGVESLMRNMSRQLFGDGTGNLGVSTAANATGSAAAPVIIISAATWKEANFEERDYVNIASSNNAYNVNNVWEITAVAPATRTVTLARISGSVDLTADAAAKTVIMQNSQNLDFTGLKGVCDATSSTLYDVNVGRRWQSFQKAAGSIGITTDLLNECMLGVHKQCGVSPNMIAMGYTQYRKFLDLLEDKKEYMIEPRSAGLKGLVSFKGIQFDSEAGPVPVILERFVEDDRVYFLNDNYITLKMRPRGVHWFDDDGTIFLRDSTDSYSARYGAYGDFYIPPSFHGVMTGLSTS
jgi:PHD/YefM family antitoxin component YafN of YafNO toxin-antitoxin module